MNEEELDDKEIAFTLDWQSTLVGVVAGMLIGYAFGGFAAAYVVRFVRFM